MSHDMFDVNNETRKPKTTVYYYYYVYFWSNIPLRKYKMYIWIVIVNVDFVLHDCCN